MHSCPYDVIYTSTSLLPLQDRITIMTQLLDWAQSDALIQQQNVSLSDTVQFPSAPPLPAATEPPYA